MNEAGLASERMNERVCERTSDSDRHGVCAPLLPVARGFSAKSYSLVFCDSLGGVCVRVCLLTMEIAFLCGIC